jgi:hypothetical protein
MGKVIDYKEVLARMDPQMAEFEAQIQKLQDELKESKDTILNTGLNEDDLDLYEYLLARWEQLKCWAKVDEKMGDARRTLEAHLGNSGTEG